ncbi:Serpentine Receptor, class T [Caenorhabditis elegans]|uniref:Serpentine Receptor, class T n=1 Tax=Caenorhabditis elegans TaxID=6239 RepID=O62413_CAEEL|nr:Serpentine Receptor, class T [Caenorhabditis elegans]CAA16321.2 Serpentine Receptor, class T [Caenorhabditis elegans]|eukprot:NP_505640.2 Serpentine Receptor, class I [Caenorhabditis elegans]
MLNTSGETIEQSVRIFMGTSGVISFFINSFGVYLICYHHGMIDDYRYYLLYFQIILLIFDIYFSILMVPIPLFPVIGGYTIGFLSNFFGISTHYQMVFTLWCIGNTNTCIFISLLKRHQVVAAIEQKNVLPRQMQAFSKMSSNLLPVLGTIAFAFSEPSELQLKIIINEKYSSISTWISAIPGIAIYDIDFHRNPAFFFLTLSIIFGTVILSTSYYILYAQLYIMLKSIKTRISNRSFKKHSVAVISTIMQNLVFAFFFLFPILILSVVILTGKDASGACLVLIGVISFHSSANTLVMCLTFTSFRKAILSFFCNFCQQNQSRTITIVPPVNNLSVTVIRVKTGMH